VVLQDPELMVRRDGLENQLRRAVTRRYSAIASDPESVRKLEEEIERLHADVQRENEKIRNLEIRSGVSGRLIMPRQEDIVGTFVRQGSTLGYVFEAEIVSVRAAVPEYDAALIREDTKGIAVRISDRPEQVLAARLVRDLPAATRELPSMALGDRAGGHYVTDPADTDGIRTVEPVVLFDVAVTDRYFERAGGRAWVKFEHSAMPLASQWYRRARQVFLQRFNPVS
ncbi:MAG: hypothetical protein PVH05_13115, partial [Burkholderiales bacterium]|jgi:putative peptide zinc metalloprotease protein